VHYFPWGDRLLFDPVKLDIVLLLQIFTLSLSGAEL